MSTIHPPMAVRLPGVWTEMKVSSAFILSYVFLRFLFRRTVCRTKRVVTFRSIKSRVKFIVSFILFILPVLWHLPSPLQAEIISVKSGKFISHIVELSLKINPPLLTSSLSGILICRVWRQTSKLGLDGRGNYLWFKNIYRERNPCYVAIQDSVTAIWNCLYDPKLFSYRQTFKQPRSQYSWFICFVVNFGAIIG